MKNKIILTITVTTLLLAGALSYHFYFAKSSAVNRSGLVGYWTMDANDINGTTYYDKSGNNKIAVSSGGPAVVAGKINQAASLNGSSQYFTITDGNSLFSPTLISLSAWIKISQTTDNNIISKNSTYYLSLGGSGVTAGKVGFFIEGVNSSYTQTNATLSDGKWHHIVANWDSANERLYVDGVLDKISGVLAGTIPVNTNALLIGYRAGDYVMNGSIDDVRVYNRALSAQEVATLYSSAKTSYQTAPSRSSGVVASGKLVGWWTMDAGDRNGTAMYDKSGQNKTASSTAVSVVSGKINQASSFNGTTSYAVASSTLSSTTNLAISVWFKTNSVAASIGRIVCVNTTVASYGICITFRDAATGLIAILHEAVAWGTSSANSYNDNKWHHAVLVKNGTSNNLYLDGGPTAVSTLTGDGTTAQYNNYIGVNLYNGALNAFFDGAIDDVRIYNYALSVQEITNLYSSAKDTYSSAPSRSGLVGWWTMDANDINGTTVYDKSGNGINGTLSGTTVAAGKLNQARYFNGSSDFLNISNFITTSGTYTFSFWVNSSQADTVTKYLFDSQTDRFILAWFTTTSGQIGFYDGSWHDFGHTPNDGKWHCITYVFNSSTSLASLYIDGSKFGSDIAYAAKNLSAGSKIIMSHYLGNQSFAQGSLDDVRIYNYALSAQQVANLYNGSRKVYMK